MIDMKIKVINLNPLILAYIGDSVYDLYIRKYLINKGICKVDLLQKESIKYVSAKGQAFFLKQMIDNKILNDKEIDIVIKARNHKVNHKPKGCDIITYKYATGLEALIGYLYYENNTNRIDEIMNYIINSNSSI